MEGLSKVRDGNTGNIVSGYMFHGVPIRGIFVVLEYEDLANKFKTKYNGKDNPSVKNENEPLY